MVYKAKTKYLKNKIRSLMLTARNKKYVKELLELERSILRTDNGGMFYSWMIHGLRSDHHKDYMRLLKALDPKEYVHEKRERRLDDMRLKRLEKETHLEELRAEMEFREFWKSAGKKI